ncbi:MAG: 2-oxo acid dehydrogenase subunit E2 [Myxococcota bacterium]|nr:2-oxo acid dehydrogenase subunit E2 [Myxococcota bacterium]MEC8423615.1 2-oxo acid dehydrogenase subunit E2 [Myxococcota bacterium]
MPSRNTRVDGRNVDPRKPSVTRRFLMWWMGPPASPWVSANAAIDMTAALAYLEQLNGAADAPRVSLQHLLCGAVGRTLARWPMANARIHRNRILPQDHVAVAMPVNLLGHAEGDKRELGLAVVERAGQRSLRELAVATRSTVSNERAGKVENPLFRMLVRLAENSPGPLLGKALDALEAARAHPAVDARLHALSPATVGLTNPGAALGDEPGVLFRGGAVNLPDRLLHIGTVWGVTPVQDEVVPVDGVPAVRPMLPVMLVFDHRLVDGVLAGRVLKTFAGILRDPAAVFGPEGHATGDRG